jgi:hypothetical protein
MKVEYVPNYIIVNHEGRVIYSQAGEAAGEPVDHVMKEYALENFKTFYICSQQQRPIFPGLPKSDVISKLRCLAPTRVAAEKAAERMGLESGGVFYAWVEPV